MTSLPRAALAAIAVLCALPGCNLDNEGEPPPEGELYFPNALTLAGHEPGEPARFLFVANSNFDLRFNSGSVQALSLSELDAELEDCRSDCRGDACREPCAIDPRDVLEDEVLIGSFVTALASSSDGRYLFAPTRTDESLTYIDVDADADGDDVLDCGDGRRCLRQATLGTDPTTGRPARWPSDPVAVSAGPVSQWLDADALMDERATLDGDAQYAAVAHRDGAVSLFYEHDGDFVFAAAQQVTDGSNVTGIGYDASTGYIYLTRERGIGRRLYRVGLVFSPIGEGSFPFAAGTVVLQGVAPIPDTRAVTFLEGAEEGDDPGLGAALREGRALVVARSPSALLLVDVDEERNRPAVATVKRITHVGVGAAKLAVGRVARPGDDGGARRLLAVVSCFSSQQIYVVDLATMEALAVVPNLSGPFDVALDTERARLYVADFKSSVLRVLDLEPALTGTEESVRVIATIGRPKIVQELQ